MAISESVRQKIKARRMALNLSQTKAAERLGLSQTGYNKIESGDTALTLDRLESIARALETTVAELMGYDAYISDLRTPADNAALQRIEAMVRLVLTNQANSSVDALTVEDMFRLIGTGNPPDDEQ